jgi:hypothetical protein
MPLGEQIRDDTSAHAKFHKLSMHRKEDSFFIIVFIL